VYSFNRLYAAERVSEGLALACYLSLNCSVHKADMVMSTVNYLTKPGCCCVLLCIYSRGQKFKTKVDFCVRSYLFRSIASEIIHDCIILSGE